jgi:hypothetical protein
MYGFHRASRSFLDELAGRSVAQKRIKAAAKLDVV